MIFLLNNRVYCLICDFQGFLPFFGGDITLYITRSMELNSFNTLFPSSLNYHCDVLTTFYGVNLVTYISYILIYFFGNSFLYIRLFTFLIASFSNLILFHSLLKLFNSNVAKYGVLIFAFWPSYFYHTLDSFKEPYIILAILMLFYFSATYKQTNIRYIVLIAFPLCLLFFLVDKMIFNIFLGYWTLSLFLKFIPYGKKIIILFVLSSFIFSPFIIKRHHIHPLLNHHLVNALEDENQNQSSFHILPFKSPNDLDTKSEGKLFNGNKIILSSFLYIYVYGLLHVFFGPFLWKLNNSPHHLIIIPQLLFSIFAFPFCIKGMVHGLMKNFNLYFPLIFLIVALCSIMALSEGNMGALVRHRDWLMPFALFLFYNGWLNAQQA